MGKGTQSHRFAIKQYSAVAPMNQHGLGSLQVGCCRQMTQAVGGVLTQQYDKEPFECAEVAGPDLFNRGVWLGLTGAGRSCWEEGDWRRDTGSRVCYSRAPKHASATIAQHSDTRAIQPRGDSTVQRRREWESPSESHFRAPCRTRMRSKLLNQIRAQSNGNPAGGTQHTTTKARRTVCTS
jgi:hypothetical protein